MQSAGFTLIEMLLVVIIISTLAAMTIPRFAGRAEDAKIAAASTDIHSAISSALYLYEVDNGAYPTTEQGLAALLSEPTATPLPRQWRGPYLKRKDGLKDPWGHDYVYRCPGIHNTLEYDLASFGPDGTENIANWEDTHG